ncbi:MAG: penicillin-binding protein [Deltaproteobacteria bacterium]|nr:penicillin-binding protein [Deltaproteobacteria bacterium]
MPRSRRTVFTLILALLLAGAGVGVLSAESGGTAQNGAREVTEGADGDSEGQGGSEGLDEAPVDPAAGFDPRDHRLDGDHLVADLDGGNRAVLTLDPGLQEHLTDELNRYSVPYASVVAIEPATGRVLAYVSHSSANPDGPDLALDPTPPTASIFKIITAAALVDAGVGADDRHCYSGGSSRLLARHIEDSDSDNRCATLGDAVGGSINAVIAKFADRNLDAPTLERYASAFGFGHGLPFDVATRPSPGEVPHHETDRLEFVRTSAGFWHMHMSPLHGALIAATFANDGQMPRASMIDSILSPQGDVLRRHEPEAFRSVISRRTAREVGRMMENTVSRGTARRTFHDQQGRPFLPDIRVAGKTGTLSGANPYRGYTWWVGFAPAEAPTIAVAALAVNTPLWRIKASYVAREALRYYLVERPAAAN